MNNGQAKKVEAIVIANSAAFSEIKESTASALSTAVAQVCGGGAAQAQAEAVAEAVSTVSPNEEGGHPRKLLGWNACTGRPSVICRAQEVPCLACCAACN